MERAFEMQQNLLILDLFNYIDTKFNIFHYQIAKTKQIVNKIEKYLKTNNQKKPETSGMYVFENHEDFQRKKVHKNQTLYNQNILNKFYNKNIIYCNNLKAEYKFKNKSYIEKENIVKLEKENIEKLHKDSKAKLHRDNKAKLQKVNKAKLTKDDKVNDNKDTLEEIKEIMVQNSKDMNESKLKNKKCEKISISDIKNLILELNADLKKSLYN